MKTILLMTISLIFLSACQSNNLSFVGEQCQTRLIRFEGSDDIDLEKSFCRCRTYYVSESFIGSKGTVIRKNLKYCDHVTGYSVKDNERFVNFMEEIRAEINEPIKQNEH